jgi:hypothetical protein
MRYMTIEVGGVVLYDGPSVEAAIDVLYLWCPGKRGSLVVDREGTVYAKVA